MTVIDLHSHFFPESWPDFDASFGGEPWPAIRHDGPGRATIMLGETAAGVPSAESHVILDMIDGLPGDIAVLIIEHDMDVVFRFAERITVLVRRGVLVEGTPDEIAANDEVRAVYLGEAAHG